MHVISRHPLREFWNLHLQSKVPLGSWLRLMERGVYADFHAIRKTFGAADYVAPYTIFDIGGNKYRIVSTVHYNRKRVYIRHVFTHSQYDEWSRKIQRKGTDRS